jgi:hypothetical protein
VRLELNGPHLLLVYADDVSRLGDNRYRKDIETLIEANKVCLKVNAEKTKYMFLSRQGKT